MKNIIVLVGGLAFLLMIFCAQKVNLEAEKAQVKIVVDQLGKLIETEDMDLFSKIVAHDSDMVYIGTDAADRIVGWKPLKEIIEKQNASIESAKVTVKNQVIKVNQSGNTAWFSEIMDCDIIAQGQAVNLQGLRYTGVLEKRNGNWVLVQSHGSVPVSGQAVAY